MITHTHRSLWAVPAVLAAASLFATPTRADSPALPYVGTPFTDNMVLQRGISDPIWGWTTPGATVKVRVAGKGAVAVAGPDGKWTAHLPKLPVGGPYALTISGPQNATLQNVMVGDVWLCTGQSNMEFGVGNMLGGDAAIAAANNPNIRLFTVPKATALTPQATAAGQWQVCTPDTIKSQGTWNGFSAVGYVFGLELNQKLHVPIGLLQTSYGGTPAEAWTSGPALTQHMPDFRDAIVQLDNAVSDRGKVSQEQRTAAYYKANDPGSASGLSWADPAFDDTGWTALPTPGYWQQAGIPALANVNGIGWYRKEVDLPAEDAGKAAVFHMTADDNDTTWINGVQIGYTEGFNVPRAYPIPAGLLHAGHNVIAVRVLDTGGGGGIWGGAGSLHLDIADTPSLPLAGPWQFRLAKPLTALPPVPADVSSNPSYPSELYNAMISPLIPFGVKGALWYQGENNANKAYQYRTLLPTMINDWRERWGEGPFPFLIVQLAGYQPGGPSWPELREAQALTASTLPNAGLVTAIDIGDQNDIHPKDKIDVGHRLALVAEAQVYHENVPDYGPVYAGMNVQGNAVTLTFHDVDGGLIAKGGSSLTGFTIAGADQNFVPADTKIVGNTLVVSSPQVSSPVAVRYAWTPYAELNFYNAAGLPAFPFRTDSWPGITDHNK